MRENARKREFVNVDELIKKNDELTKKLHANEAERARLIKDNKELSAQVLSDKELAKELTAVKSALEAEQVARKKAEQQRDEAQAQLHVRTVDNGGSFVADKATEEAILELVAGMRNDIQARIKEHESLVARELADAKAKAKAKAKADAEKAKAKAEREGRAELLARLKALTAEAEDKF